MTIPAGVVRRNIKCHKCSETTKCIINRRIKPRHSLPGKVVLITEGSREIEVTLVDISEGGTGASFDLPFGNPKVNRIQIGSKVRLKCGWNPRLFGSGHYVVRNVKGLRVGVSNS